MCVRSVFTLGVSVAMLFGTDVLAQVSGIDAQRAAWQRAHRVLDASNSTNLGVAPVGPDTASEPATLPPSSSSDIVSVQALGHEVPRKAQKEWEKAEKARLHRRLDEAIAHFERAIQIDPDFVSARNNLGAMYLTMAKPQAAVPILEEAVKLDPHNPMPFSNLALGYTMLNRLPDAERAARQTVDLARVNVRPKMILGLILVSENKFTDEAIQLLGQAQTAYPQAYLLKARILAGRGERDKAKAEIQSYMATGDGSGLGLADEWLRILEKKDQQITAHAARR